MKKEVKPELKYGEPKAFIDPLPRNIKSGRGLFKTWKQGKQANKQEKKQVVVGGIMDWYADWREKNIPLLDRIKAELRPPDYNFHEPD